MLVVALRLAFRLTFGNEAIIFFSPEGTPYRDLHFNSYNVMTFIAIRIFHYTDIKEYVGKLPTFS